MTATVPPPPRPPMDPRLRARRIAVARAEGRRRLHRLIAVLTVAALVLAAWGVLHSPLMAVGEVEVRGAAQTGAAAVVEAAAIPEGQLMVRLDIGAVRRRVEALPWVAEARVERRWPRTVRVSVAEREALVTAQAADGSWVLVDASGRSLASVPSPPPGYLRLSGPVPPGPPGSALPSGARGALAAAAAIPASLAGSVAAVAWEADGSVSLGLVPDGRAVLGPPDRLADKFLALGTVLATGEVAPGDVVDVQVPSAPVVRPAATVPSPTGGEG